jgi:signal peptidase
VLSGSMEPVFYSGDVVIVRKTDPGTLKESDIIAFRNGTSVITHRIVGVKDLEAGAKQFTTKGDNNNVEDALAVTSDMVEGKYLLRVAKIGNFAMFLQTPVGMIVFVALPLILFVLYDVLRRTLSGKKADKRTLELEAELDRMRSELAAKEVESAEAKSAEEIHKDPDVK